MFSFIVSLKNGISNFYRSLKDKFYHFLSLLGYKLIPPHFTSDDQKNYKSWIGDFNAQIKQILKYSRLPVYLQSPELADMKFSHAKGFYLENIGYLNQHNDRPLKEFCFKISNAIKHYVQGLSKTDTFLARLFSADRNKQDPQRMVITIIQDYLMHNLIYYSDKEYELQNLKSFIKYITSLTYLDSVKQHKDFHAILLTVNKYLHEAKTKLKTRIKLGRLREQTTSLLDLITNHIYEKTVYLYNTLCFSTLGAGSLESDTNNFIMSSSSQFLKWLKLFLAFFKQETEYNDEILIQFKLTLEQLSSLSFSDLDYSTHEFTDAIPIIKQLFEGDKIRAKYYCSNLALMQQNLLYLLATQKVLQLINDRILSNTFKVCGDELKNLQLMINNLNDKLPKVQENYNQLKHWNRLFEQFKINSSTTYKMVVIAEELQSLALNSISSLQQISSIVDNIDCITKPLLKKDLGQLKNDSIENKVIQLISDFSYVNFSVIQCAINPVEFPCATDKDLTKGQCQPSGKLYNLYRFALSTLGLDKQEVNVSYVNTSTYRKSL